PLPHVATLSLHDALPILTTPEGRESGITVQLLDGDGTVIDEVETDSRGTYRFPSFAGYDDYRVVVVPPAGLIADGPTERDVDLSEGDQTEVDFAFRAPEPGTGSITGTVTRRPATRWPGWRSRSSGRTATG